MTFFNFNYSKDQFVIDCLNGRTEKVKEHLSTLKHVGENAVVALCKAVIYDRVDIVKLILDDGRIDPTRYNNNLIYEAVSREYIEIVELLSNDDRVDPSEYSQYRVSTYDKAVMMGNIEILNILFKKMKDVDYLSVLKTAIVWRYSILDKLLCYENFQKAVFKLPINYFEAAQNHIVKNLNIDEQLLLDMYKFY